MLNFIAGSTVKVNIPFLNQSSNNVFISVGFDRIVYLYIREMFVPQIHSLVYPLKVHEVERFRVASRNDVLSLVVDCISKHSQSSAHADDQEQKADDHAY